MVLQNLEANQLSLRILLQSDLQPHFHNSSFRNSISHTHTHTIARDGSQVALGMSTHLPNALLKISAASSFSLRRCSDSGQAMRSSGREGAHPWDQVLPALLACSELTSTSYRHLPNTELSMEAELRSPMVIMKMSPCRLTSLWHTKTTSSGGRKGKRDAEVEKRSTEESSLG